MCERERGRTCGYTALVGYHVMVLIAWRSSEERLECALSQVGTHPDMALNVARV